MNSGGVWEGRFQKPGDVTRFLSATARVRKTQKSGMAGGSQKSLFQSWDLDAKACFSAGRGGLCSPNQTFFPPRHRHRRVMAHKLHAAC